MSHILHDGLPARLELLLPAEEAVDQDPLAAVGDDAPRKTAHVPPPVDRDDPQRERDRLGGDAEPPSPEGDRHVERLVAGRSSDEELARERLAERPRANADRRPARSRRELEGEPEVIEADRLVGRGAEVEAEPEREDEGLLEEPARLEVEERDDGEPEVVEVGERDREHEPV